jgi:hypothetical protein
MERYFDTALNNKGEPAVGLTVTVTDANGNNATLYSDNGVTTTDNPFYTDKNGAFSFYAANGRYTVTLTSDGVAPAAIKDIILDDPADKYFGDTQLAAGLSADLATTANGKGADLVANAAKKVASIAALRALRVPQGSDAQTVIVDGATSPIIWNATSTAADDGANVFMPNSLTSGQAGRWLNTAVASAKLRGAKGDGVTDDSAILSGASGNVRLSPGTYYCATSVTISTGLIFEAGAVIKPASGITVTLSNFVDAPLTQIFDLSAGGTIAGNFYAPKYFVQWWGAKADGNYSTGAGTDNTASFQAAINVLNTSGGAALHVPAGIYKLASQITLPSGVSLIGAGKWSSILFCPSAFSNNAGLIAINGTGGYPTEFKGFGVLAQTGGAGGDGIHCTKNGVFISDVWVNGFGVNNIYLGSTDVFLFDFASEQGTHGVVIDSPHVNVSNGTTYQNTQYGVTITHNAVTNQNGPVHVSNVRDTEASYCGFFISGDQHVFLDQCSSYSHDNTKYNGDVSSGFYITNSTNVELNGCNAIINSGQQTTGYGVQVANNSAVVKINGGTFQGWNDGVHLAGGTQLTVNGVSATGNAGNGIYAGGGDRVIISNNQCIQNGSTGATESGIYADNTAAYAVFNITGNVCTQNGGGPQKYGIYANVTNSNAFTNLVGNICKYNATASINKVGTTANIGDTGNMV